jgi:hypothetical protein
MLKKIIRSVNRCSPYKIKIKCITIYLISIFHLIIVFSYYYLHSTFKTLLNHQLKEPKIYYELKKEFGILDKSRPHCNPFIKTNKSGRIIIDGESYPKTNLLHQSNEINFECLNSNKKIKTILLWTPFLGDFAYFYGLGERKPFVENNCPVSNCELTSDKERINESDFIVFHMADKISSLPSHRSVNQRWIFMLYESPVNSKRITEHYHIHFNMTSTYKIDSHFPGFYAVRSLIKWKSTKSSEFYNENTDYLNEKVNFAVAIISNCNDESKRLEYINELQSSITVDIFGKCGNPCPSKFIKTDEPGKCKEIVAEEYKFYLAFENSICLDYITEKFFDILKYNIIPVVLGGGRYDYHVRITSLFLIA